MKRDIKQIRTELKQRSINIKSIKEVLLGGIMLAVEDLGEELKKRK
ncbi:MAG: hypothetical protein V1888_00875 [archaeon]